MPDSSNHTRPPQTRLIGLLSVFVLGCGLAAVFWARPEYAATQDRLEDRSETAPPPGAAPMAGFKEVTSESEIGSFAPSIPLASDLPRYKITELHPLPWDRQLGVEPAFHPYAVNNKGDVVGGIYASYSRTNKLAPHQASFIYRKGKFESVAVPSGYLDLNLTDINELGQATGIATAYPANKPPSADVVLYEKGHLRILDAFSKAFGEKRKPITSALSPLINNEGSLIAWYGGNTYLWNKGQVSDIGPGRVLDINNRGLFVGVTDSPDGRLSVSRLGNAIYGKNRQWNPLLLAHPSQEIRNSHSSAEAVNDQGQIVVSIPQEPLSALLSSGVRYTEQRTLYVLTDGKKDRAIATLSGLPAKHLRMNNRGDIVGFTQLIYGARSIPLLYSGGKMYDINAALKGQGWTLRSIMDINDRGEIIALGAHKGALGESGVLLTPIKPR